VSLGSYQDGRRRVYLLDDGGRNHFAGSAPCGEAVQDDEGVFVAERLPVVVHPAQRIRQLLVSETHDVAIATETWRNKHLRLEVVHALFVFAHFAGGGEKLWGEVCGRSGVEGCSHACRCKYGSSEPSR
jgi:hypothetical protein